ncbi:LuxR C-terminal-related transcriptional regulator [Chloroflexus sp.]|uniref:LuxR C-terminal-related transcriptional regulator n=1 Tax=Chloroflexus sp. TaxID=1904827 RepID=UPI00298F03CF|nr:LuxR C-terminal-related transcriptional regulator [Chloroflexus sp.]MDW8404214.1 LuxR C-terminal-related transcriptional regulator [Chloroflexus sp.]
MTTTLLITKITLPLPTPTTLARPHLVARLNEGLAHQSRLSLIAAPAGYGKTTLAATWSAQCARPIAWLSLDEADDDPIRFGIYFLSALQRVYPSLGASLLPVLRAGQSPPPTIFAATILNELAQNNAALVCVLDDFHLIHDQVILALVHQLLTHATPAFHLTIVSREDPALPLARLRANNQLVEVRAADLRFDRAEVIALLRDQMQLALGDAELDQVLERTEGWPAGVQLAGLSLQGAPDPARLVAELSGSHCFILSYLTEEVLARQPPDVQEFLLQTSILDRFTSELCDTITGRTNSAALIDYLVAANLFLVPQDDTGMWYRYHRLFAELLQTQLRRRHPTLVATLHRRASHWYEAQGRPVEAIDHALAASEHERALALLERHGWALLNAGYTHTLERWLRALPTASIQTSPRLCLDFGWMRLLRGQLDQVEPLLAQAETACATQSHANHTALRAECLALRANLNQAVGRIPEAITAAEASLAANPTGNERLTGLAALALGGAYRQLPDFTNAVSALQRAARSAHAAGDPVTEMLAIAHLTLLATQYGRLRLAADTATAVIQRREQTQTEPSPIFGVVYGALGLVYYEWNDLGRSREYLERSIHLGMLAAHNASVIYSQCTLARLLQAKGDLVGAAQILDTAESLLGQGAPEWVRPELIAQQTALALATGDLTAAVMHLRRSGITPADPATHRTLLVHLSWLRLLLAQRDQHTAELAQRLIDVAEATGRCDILLRTLILSARYYQHERSIAAQLLKRALAIAEAEGYVRVFVEAGEEITHLLRQIGCPSWLAIHLPPSTPRAFFDQMAATSLDPLSEREATVLQLLAQGLTYAEIAEQLVISINTVRFHVKTIYSKLEANNRTQAVARARELGWL